LIVKSDDAQVHSWNQPVLYNECKVSCSRWESLMRFKPTTDRLRVRCTIQCPMPPLWRMY